MKVFALRPTLLALAALGLAACKGGGSVTNTECASLLDHFFDLKINESPDAQNLPPAQKEAYRASVKQAAASDPDVKQVTEQCQSEVTRSDFDCGRHATTSKQWNDCIQ